MNDIVLNEIIALATKFNVDRVLLYGSRARGDHSPLSDYDVAVFAEHLSATEKVFKPRLQKWVGFLVLKLSVQREYDKLLSFRVY